MLGPILVRILLPCAPEYAPAKGATVADATEYGNINKPVVNASYFNIPCKNKGSKIAFVNIVIYDVITAILPKVNGLILNILKFIMG